MCAMGCKGLVGEHSRTWNNQIVILRGEYEGVNKQGWGLTSLQGCIGIWSCVKFEDQAVHMLAA